jgi:hypothetical protein
VCWIVSIISCLKQIVFIDSSWRLLFGSVWLIFKSDTQYWRCVLTVRCEINDRTINNVCSHCTTYCVHMKQSFWFFFENLQSVSYARSSLALKYGLCLLPYSQQFVIYKRDSPRNTFLCYRRFLSVSRNGNVADINKNLRMRTADSLQYATFDWQLWSLWEQQVTVL